ncbi:MAG TPA: vWA domain-containing protein [Polyangia bacterium]|nr:vWA domain-containing protein [Polyangia bacterium]
MKKLTIVLAVLGAIGCADGPGSGGGLQVKQVSTVAQAPGNVAAYFSVYTKEGKPVTDLDVPNFKVYENDKLVSEKKAKRALLETKPVEAQYMLVLVDVSGPFVDGEDYPDLITAVGKVVDTIDKSGEAAVSLFDGEDEIVPMLGFGAQNTRAGLDSARHFRPRNRNGNLDGAIVQGLDAVEKQLDAATAPFRYGTLVVVTDRGDLAHKVTAEAVKKRVANSPVDVEIVAVGPKAKREELEPLASPGGLFISDQPKDFSKGLVAITKKINDASDARYLFSYCSSKRSGKQTLTLVVETQDDRGRIVTKFDADGFRSGCSAKHRPLFEKAAASKEDKPSDKESE